MRLLCSAEEDLSTVAAGELALSSAYGSGEGVAAGGTTEITGLTSVSEPSADPLTML